MPFPFLIPLIMSGLGAAGGALSNRAKKSSSGYNNTTTSTSTPTLDPQFGGLRDTLLQSVTSRLSSPQSLMGYEQQGIGKINNAFDVIKQTQQNNLTARGLGASPIAGAVDANREFSRAGQVGEFQAGVPLVQRDLQNQDLGMAQRLLAMFQGQTNTQTSSGTGTQTQPGNVAGGALGGLGQMLGFLMGQGLFSGGSGGGQPRPLI